MKSFGRAYLCMMLASLATAAVVAILGYFPTLRLGGSDAIGAMFAGIAISLIASCIGSAVIGLGGRKDPTKAPQAVLLASTIRFVVTLALTASVVLSDWFEPLAIGLWVGIAYLAMLLVDTIYAVRLLGADDRPDQARIDPRPKGSST